MKKSIWLVSSLALAVSGALADDGAKDDRGNPVRVDISHLEQIYELPVIEDYPGKIRIGDELVERDVVRDEVVSEHASIKMMQFYVPAQARNNELEDRAEIVVLEYYNADGALVEEKEYARPLVAFYTAGPVKEVPCSGGFQGHGMRDMWTAVSLDDGLTWKRKNLSKTAELSSFTINDGNKDDYEGSVHINDKHDDEEDDRIRGDFEECVESAEYVPLPPNYDYPGDVLRNFASVGGDKAIAVWRSRFCQRGFPAYSLEDEEKEAILEYLGEQPIGTAVTGDGEQVELFSLELDDVFGVAGPQRSSDMADEGYELVGELPFTCMWTARGTLEYDDETGLYDMIWFKPERLTSGRRDAERMEVVLTPGSGAVVTWQEDPDGLRPGQGEGPGEGWSAAVAHHKTDIWYSYVSWDDFDTVWNDENGDNLIDVGEIAEYDELAETDALPETMPKPGVPMAVPMRLSDNDKCAYYGQLNPFGKEVRVWPYCDYEIAQYYGLKDYCVDVIEADDEYIKSDLCVTEDGLPLMGNTAATRTRLRLYNIETDTGRIDADSYVVLAYEESKGLGAFYFQISEDGGDLTACEDDGLPDQDQGEVTDDYECVEFDIGKNIWYHAFPMSGDGLAQSLVAHGDILNQPEVDWRTGEFYPVVNTEDLWDFGDYNFDIYNTEIARRFSMISQDADIWAVGGGNGNGNGNADDDDDDDDSSDDKPGQGKGGRSNVANMASSNGAALANGANNGNGNRNGQGRKEGLVAFPMWKQGIMRQGGPADTMARRIVMTNQTDGNPYAVNNMACDEWAYEDGTNQYYPNGICLDPAINLSGVTPLECWDLNASGEPGSETPVLVDCPTVDDDGIGTTNPDDQTLTIKTVSWVQCQEGATLNSVDGSVNYTCEDSDLDDQSWENPFDVAKGHRGYADGDIIMMLYAWSPTDKLNDKGHDRYELYVRRSFDGGLTWTTTPGDLGGDGTVTCETYRRSETQVGGIDSEEDLEPVVCYDYGAGDPEQARNVSQLKSRRWTVLDPRFAKTPASIVDPGDNDYIYPAYLDDERDPSRYFIIFENGDNTTTAEGEPEPLDLYYSRAINYGDDYVVWADEVVDPTLSECYPSDPHEDDDLRTLQKAGTGFCNEFERLNHVKVHGSEASMAATPAGTFMYAVWNQGLKEDLPMVDDDDEDHDSDDDSADDGDEIESTGATRTGVAMRRIWYIDGYIPEDAWDFGQGPNEDNQESLELIDQ